MENLQILRPTGLQTFLGHLDEVFQMLAIGAIVHQPRCDAIDKRLHPKSNQLGFHIVEFWNKHFRGPAIPKEEAGNWHEDDEMFLFKKVMR